MTSVSGLGIGLSLVFGCLLFALVAELYFLLWWNKRSFTSEVNDEFTKYAKELFHFICWKKGSSSSSSSTSEAMNQESSDIEIGCKKEDLLLKSSEEEEDELELMRLHNLAGPPRFLFTIKEEAKEDLESEDRSRTRSLSDLILTVDTPFLTPLPSPPFKHHGFNINPLFESSTDLGLNMLLNSPPSKFRFLREAEEKLYRRLMEESQKKTEEEEEKQDGFCCTIEREHQNHCLTRFSNFFTGLLKFWKSDTFSNVDKLPIIASSS